MERLAPQLCLSLLGTVAVGGQGQYQALTEEKVGEQERSWGSVTCREAWLPGFQE